MIVVDIETSGLEPDEHSILSLGAVNFNKPEEMFYQDCQVREGAKIDDFALKVNGYSKKEIKDQNKQTEKDLIINFLSWALDSREKIFAALVPNFDYEFIKYCCKIYKINHPFDFRPVDLYSVAHASMIRNKVKPFKLEKGRVKPKNIYTYVGMPTEPKPHIAINGAKWETEAFHRLLNGKSVFKEFKDYKVPEFLRRR